MPSRVAFTETGRLIRVAAENQASINPANTIFGALRFIRRRFDDPEIQEIIKDLSFRVVQDTSGGPAFVVQHQGGELTITPMEILSMLLGRARRDAQRYLGHHPISAVIVIPASFSSFQRQAVRHAAMIADIEPLRLLSAAVSACVDYATTQQPVSETNILIADFGAGSIDVAVATVEKGLVEIRAVAGANYLGGDDINTRLVRYAANIFRRKTSSNLTTNSRALRRLRTACEKAKQELSSQTQTIVDINQLCDGHDFVWTVTQQTLEECYNDLLRACLLPIEQALRDAHMKKSMVHAAIAIGGSSTPQLQHHISKLFSFMDLSKCINLDEAAARGAAFNAAILSGDLSSKLTAEALLFNVIPFTIGIKTDGGVMTPILKRNTNIPTKYSDTFTLTKDNRNNKSFLLSVFKGERVRTMHNRCLGKSVLPLSHIFDDAPQIKITVDCDSNSNIEIHAIDKSSGIRTQIPCVDSDRSSTKDLVLLKAKAAGFDVADDAEEKRIEAKNAAEEYIFALLDRLGSRPQTDATRQKTHLANIILEWLNENNDVAVSEYTVRLHQLQEVAEITVDPSTEQRPVEVEQKENKGALSLLVSVAEKIKRTDADDARLQAGSETEVGDKDQALVGKPIEQSQASK